MLGKLIDGRLVVAGNIIKDGNTTITNPTEEKLKELGYKTIEYTEKPIFNKEEEKLQEVYTDGETITVSYEVIALTDEEHNEIIKRKIVEEENKITKRNMLDFLVDKDQKAKELIDIHRDVIINLRTKLRKVENIEK